MKVKAGWAGMWLMLAVGCVCLAFAGGMSAQVKTETTTTAGQPTKQVTVERGEVVSVEGNDLFVKMEDGTIRHIPNVPESARATVDGKEVGIHDLKPGMKLQKTVTTTTTPKTVTTVESVTGTVWHVAPPVSVILTLENGQNQQFKIPKGQIFTINGQELDAFHLKKGMKVTATRITEVPETHVSHAQNITGTAPPPPPANVPILIAETPKAAAEASTVAAATPAPTKLPKTGSIVPLLGMLGLLSTGASLALRMLRK